MFLIRGSGTRMERFNSIPIVYQRKKKKTRKALVVYTRKRKEKLMVGGSSSRRREAHNPSNSGAEGTQPRPTENAEGKENANMQGPEGERAEESPIAPAEKESRVKNTAHNKMEGMGDSKELEDLLNYFN